MTSGALLLPVSLAEPPCPKDLSGAFEKDLHAGLNRLRLVALRCRAARRIDAFVACALLATDRQEMSCAYANAFLRVLPQALAKTPVFHAPGCADLSFDEAWILRLLQAVREGWSDTIAFLVASRVKPGYRRQVAFLARGLSAGLDTV